ncbi:hypothetical protein [Pseudomarimonas arenosa]|uniref:Uncharacterized protein n=1 Tax=Pseudomarimonas arenosa TaxID=2774145 RepID=A0AAW3ZNX4_9GAMM|nr:hypothetical protein [Pseudomarimonas arenosa]MBD8526787.1 hypothetical protein [Pseudomarimonas arenosa]
MLFHASRRARFWRYALVLSGLISVALAGAMLANPTGFGGLASWLALVCAVGMYLPAAHAPIALPNWQRGLIIALLALPLFYAWRLPKPHFALHIAAPAMLTWGLIAMLAPASRPANRHWVAALSSRLAALALWLKSWATALKRGAPSLTTVGKRLRVSPSPLLLVIITFAALHIGAYAVIAGEWQPLAGVLLSLATLNPLADGPPAGTGEPGAVYWLSFGLLPSALAAGLIGWVGLRVWPKPAP